MDIINNTKFTYTDLISDIKLLIKSSKIESEFKEDNLLPVFDKILIAQRKSKLNLVVKTDPIDEIHKESILKSKQAFADVRNGKNLDVLAIQNLVDESLPDLTGNNNVLSRIRQLKEDDDYTYRHSFNVSLLAVAIGKWLGYSDSELKDLSLAGLLFDVGKLKIPPYILQRPNQVTAKEKKIIQQHTVLGYNMLKELKLPESVILSSLQHHEKVNGEGYPLKIKENQIHEFAQIIHICDAYDAMTTNKVYSEKKSPFEAADIIRKESGISFSSSISFIFLMNLVEFYSGCDVSLNNGQIGKIIHISPMSPTKPTILVDNKFIDLSKESNLKIVDIV